MAAISLTAWTHFIYSLIVIVSCLIIFFKTKDLYKISGHQGIKYFRYTFLFFGLSFVARLLAPVFRAFLEIRPHIFHPGVNFLIVYTGTMAAISLLFSFYWKRFKLSNPTLVIHLIAMAISVLTLFGRIRLFVLLTQAIIFPLAIIFGYFGSRKSKKHGSMFVLYFLLFLSWIGNVFAHFATRISLALGLSLNIVSIVLFVIILVRVLKLTK